MHPVTAPRLLSRASTSSSSIRSNVLTCSRSSFRLQQQYPARRFYSSEPPKKPSGIKFWPFLVVIGAGSLAYKSTPTFSASDVTVLFVLGGPGAGKGTQCARLVSDYGFTHLSAGDLLRAEQDRPGSQFGQLIKDYIKDGLIVPMEVTVQLLENAMTETIKKQGNKRFLIDGFPRKMDQAIKFEETVCPAKLVLFYDCPEDVMESRLLERGKTSGRADDNAESIRKRFRTFVETSMPVVDYYEKQGRVVKLDATPTPQDVYAKTRTELSKRLGL
ncbi:uridylate kinase [Colletotrichum higginsianum]|nr:uridylate kinase [Colletotrichum higginsianum]